MGLFQIVWYLAAVFCFAVTAAKLIRIARMPVHIRWDLYPIPHEKGRGSYGGSYYEEVDWWTKPRRFALFAELREVAVEILFIRSLYRHNRSLWLVSYPFHLGLYSLVVFALLIALGSFMEPAGSSVANGVVYYFTIVSGVVGWTLTIFGATGLLLSRIFRKDLRIATIRSDYFNLGILLTVSVIGFTAWLTADTDYTIMRRLVGAMLTMKLASEIPTALQVQVWVTSALLFYFPFTHMTHVFSKFFTYHSVRWEDHPNIRDSRIEKAVTEALGYNLTWAAPHIRKGTWAEAATGEKKSVDE